jgi:hypothetical protein
MRVAAGTLYEGGVYQTDVNFRPIKNAQAGALDPPCLVNLSIIVVHNHFF